MKTTLELPDGLLERIKLRAVHRKRKLKDEIVHLLEAGMAQAHAPETPRKPPKPVRLRGRRPITLREIEAAIAAGRDSARERRIGPFRTGQPAACARARHRRGVRRLGL